MTRAAATRSRSCVIVEAIQSMYDGSNAAISPSVWPWNLPKLHLDGLGLRESRAGRRPEMAHSAPAERAGRVRSARRLGCGPLRAKRRHARRAVHGSPVAAKGLVAGRERLGCIETSGDRPAGARPGWPVRPTGRAPGRFSVRRRPCACPARPPIGTVERRATAGPAGPRAALAVGGHPPPVGVTQLLVRGVDLGHLPRGGPRRARRPPPSGPGDADAQGGARRP